MVGLPARLFPSMAQAAIAVFVNHQANWNLLLKAGLRAVQKV